MKEYRLFLYDVWGNSKDGYEVNDSFPALINNGFGILGCNQVCIWLKEDATSLQINRLLKLRGIKWDVWNSEYDIYGAYKKNGKPFGFLREVEGN